MMKKYIIAIAIATITSGMLANAQNRTFTYTEEDEYGDFGPDYGSLRRVSPNGLWATGGDEADETGSFIINTQDPENIINTTYYTPEGTLESGLLLDINDEGMAVGTYYEAIYYTKYKHAAIFKDGKWMRLPEPEGILGTSQAVAISADSKLIAGHALCENEQPDEPGRYFPVTWRLNEATGEYEIDRLYSNIYVPGTYGFFVYDMTPNGKYICGIEALDFGDVIGVLLDVETGELKRFHDIEYRNTYFENPGGYFPTMYVDGIMDGGENNPEFNEMFIYATDRYIYGSHAVVSDVKEDGTGNITNYAAIYDLETGEFIDGPKNQLYTCGIGTDVLFTTRGNIIKDGKETSITGYVGTGDQIAGIYSVDEAGKVMTGAYVAMTPFGEQFESPVLVLLDEASQLGSIKNISGDDADNTNVEIDGRMIKVSGAKAVVIYNTEGQQISAQHKTTVAPGAYVVVADGVAHKVLIK